MTDIGVVATIPIRPDKAEFARPHLADLATGTRAEAGCISYELFESGSAPGLFITIERWKSQADLEGHMATPHVADAFAVLGESLAGEVAVHPLVPQA